MKYLLYILLFLLPTRALAQTSDTVPFVNSIDTIAFMKEARKHFEREFIQYKKDFRIVTKNTSIADTANIKHIVPIYGLRDMGKYDKLTDIIFFSPDSTNQFYMIYNGRDYWTGMIFRGIASYIKRLNEEANDIVRIPIANEDGFISHTTNIEDNKKREQLFEFLTEHQNWKFFYIFEMKDFWAFDEDNRLLRVSIGNDKINIEDGEEFYQKMIEKNGIDCIKRLLEGDSCEKYIFYSPIPEKKKKKNHRAD